VELGVIGFPFSGKTTVLQALCGQTFSGHLAVAPVPDRRLDVLAAMFVPKKVTPATLQLQEVAGVVPGRLDKAGRNTFFDAVRRADALVHVVRFFPDPAVPHPLGRPDGQRDAQQLEEEMILADLEHVQTLLERFRKKHNRSTEEERQRQALERCQRALEDVRPLRLAELDDEARTALSGFGLLTLRPELLVCNVAEEAFGAGLPDAFLRWVESVGATVVEFSAAVESEIARLEPGERAAFLAAYGLTESATERVARAAYGALRLISFLTAGPDEVRAWPITEGTTARRAAGKIHSDIERGFIRAEVVAFQDLERVGSWKALREQGAIRLEGKDYIVRDGDIINFRFHV